MSKAKALLKQVREGLSELKTLSSVLPESDRKVIDSISSSFSTFEKGLEDAPSEPKETSSKGTIPMDAKEDSMRI